MCTEFLFKISLMMLGNWCNVMMQNTENGFGMNFPEMH